MSAPNNTITLKEEVETLWENPPDESAIIMLATSISCSCGFKGILSDLLCDPDDETNVPNNFWCPQCRTRGWSFD